MTPQIVLATIVGYFILLFTVSWFAGRKADNNSFFTGNRATPWYIATFAMIGAAISGVTFISVPGMVGAKGFSYLQMVLGFMVGYFIIALILVPLFYKRNLISIYGYLEQRFGNSTYQSGAWFFFVSKMLGAAVRFFVVCVVLQILVFDPLGIHFVINVMLTILLIWLYTMQGGVKTIVWTDTLKTFCLITAVVLCILFIANNMGLNFGEMVSGIYNHPTSQVFFFDNPKEGTYFWKQFIAGVFMVIATVGLDQDMMQRTLACKSYKDSQKNMIVSGILQVFVVSLFLLLGTLLFMYVEHANIPVPQKPDELFGLIAADKTMPIIVGVLFILGLVAAAYSAAGSALTSLTTSFTVDILKAHDKQTDHQLTKTRKLVHVGMSILMGIVIIIFYYLSDDSAINAVYKIASYTYGPILGLFAFGMLTKKSVIDRWVPIICISSPIICFFIQKYLNEWFHYEMSFELLLLNAFVTFVGLSMFIKRNKYKI